MIVIDASVAIEFLLGLEPGFSKTFDILKEDGVVHAPYLIDAEVGQVLRKFVLRGELSSTNAQAALQDWFDLPVIRYEHRHLYARAFELHPNFTFYDALYLALAECLDATLCTRDNALTLRNHHHANVIVI